MQVPDRMETDRAKLEPPAQGKEESFLQLKAVASRLGVSVRGVYRLFALGDLHPVKVLRSCRVSSSDLNAYMEKAKRKAGILGIVL